MAPFLNNQNDLLLKVLGSPIEVALPITICVRIAEKLKPEGRPTKEIALSIIS